jgi:predicted acyl esterase
MRDGVRLFTAVYVPKDSSRPIPSSSIARRTAFPLWRPMCNSFAANPFRGKFRHSFEKPEPFTPDKVEEVTFAI